MSDADNRSAEICQIWRLRLRGLIPKENSCSDPELVKVLGQLNNAHQAMNLADAELRRLAYDNGFSEDESGDL